MPYANNMGIFRKNSNFTVKTLRTHVTPHKSMTSHNWKVEAKKQDGIVADKPKSKMTISINENKTQKNEGSRQQNQITTSFDKQKLMFLTPHTSEHNSVKSGNNKSNLQESRQSWAKQLQGCIRMMNNESRVNRYCECCSHGESLSASPHRNRDSQSLSNHKNKLPKNSGQCKNKKSPSKSNFGRNK